jgi:hypothetical protein
MKREIAEGIHETLITCNKELALHIPKLKDDIGPEEMKSIIQPVAQMISLSFDVLDIIWSEYPDLKPEEAK